MASQNHPPSATQSLKATPPTISSSPQIEEQPEEVNPVAKASEWNVEVASVKDPASLKTNEGTLWATIVQDVLTPAYLQGLIQTLREESSLLELVTDQLFQHLLNTYKDRVETVVQTEGISAINPNLPHFKVVNHRKQNTKRLEIVLDNDKIKNYLKHSLIEFFTHAGIWMEFARVVGTNLVVWAIESLEATVGTEAFQKLSDPDIEQAIERQLHSLAPTLLLERGEIIGQIHCQEITQKIITGFQLPTCSLEDIEKLLGLKQRPLPNKETNLDLDSIAILPTSIPIASSIRAQLRPDLWQQSTDETAVFHYRSRGNPNNYIEHFITNPGDIEMLPWEAAEQIINKFGFDTVKLQLIFASRTMEEDEPWNSGFTLRASDIVHLLGWDKNHSTSLSEKRSSVASTAYALSCLLVKSVWVEGRGNRKVDASTPIGRMWDVLIDVHGQFDWVTGKIERPEEVYITVRPGLWTKHFLNRAGSRAKEALHQFGYLARDILKIDPYHNELALRLAIQLTLDSRIRVRNQHPYDYRVGSLLEEVLAKADIDKAVQDKYKGRDLRNRWNSALKLLISLGWKIEFDPATYPDWLQPDSNATKPEDWRKIRVIDRLLEAKVMIKPPDPIPTLLAKIKEPKKSKTLEAAPLQGLTGEEIRKARETQGWSRKELGGFLSLSADYIGKLERGDRMVTSQLETTLKKLLPL